MSASIVEGVKAARAGKLFIYPTDTLWGLGADARNPPAVRRLVEVKERPGGQPISVAVSSLEEVEPLAVLSESARRFLRTHLPGPYTMLLTASGTARRTLAPEVLGPGATIGIRVPDHPCARELARRVGVITATSANRHGTPPCGSLAVARRVFGNDIAAYIAARPTPSGQGSCIVDLRRAEPRMLPRT